MPPARIVVLRPVAGLVEPDAKRELRLGDSDAPRRARTQAAPASCVDRDVEVGADVEHRRAAGLDQRRRRDVAGGGDAVEASRGTPSRLHARPNLRFRRRRVGDEDHGAAGLPEAGQRVDRGGVEDDAVVDHAPDVAEQQVLVRGEVGEPLVEVCRSGPRRSCPAARGRGRAGQAVPNAPGFSSG